MMLAVLVIFVLSGWVKKPSIGSQTHALPLAEPGMFAVGVTELILPDPNRGPDHLLLTTVWYPDTAQTELLNIRVVPYPVIVYSPGYHGERDEMEKLTTHLASYGFIVVAVEHHDDADHFFLDRPRDVQAALEQLPLLSDTPIAGMMDMNRVGVMGWSMGATTALQMGGMRMDWPATYPTLCDDYHPQPARCTTQMFRENVTALWEEIGTQDENGLWYIPITTPVRAVATMGTGFLGVFGERGLASMTTPALFLHGTLDTGASDYQHELIETLYAHYGNHNCTLISFIRQRHSFYMDSDQVNHFMTAFFGYHLQDHADYQVYLTKDYINHVAGLAWGVHGYETMSR